jgi:hypothetical protein
LERGGRVTVGVASVVHANRNGIQRLLRLDDPNERRATEAALVDREWRRGALVVNRRIHTLLMSVDLGAVRVAGMPSPRG